VYLASSIQGVGHGPSLNWCADDRMPWWSHAMLRAW